MEPIVVVTTIDQESLAKEIAGLLVERQLAACVQVVGPVESLYHWQGRIETSREWQCLVKTSRANYAAVEAAIREIHTYTVPEIIALPIVAGSAAYLGWLEEQLLSNPDSTPGPTPEPDGQ